MRYRKSKIKKIIFIIFIMIAVYLVYNFTQGKYENDIVINHNSNSDSNKENNKVSQTLTNTKNDMSEMRGVWVSYISFGDITEGEKAFKSKVDEIISTALNNKMNTLIVHIRPFGDALYKSDIFPYSHLLTGTQGKDPGYDPLEYFIKKAHENGLEFHAWINPLRIKVNGTPSNLSDNNLYNIWKNDNNTENDDWFIEWDGDIYLNPAYPEVRKIIIDGVIEVVENYNVDAIHFDDYFYPTTSKEYDKTAYNKYLDTVKNNNIPLSHSEWRSWNINTLISGVYSAVHSHSDNVKFGISPQGNISNNATINADIKTWCSVYGYIDYICPQIYVSLTHPLLPFNDTIKEWRKLTICNSVKLYGGLAIYKAGSDVDDGTWLESNSIIAQEIQSLREEKFDGFMLYSYEYLDNKQTKEEIANALKVIS